MRVAASSPSSYANSVIDCANTGFAFNYEMFRYVQSSVGGYNISIGEIKRWWITDDVFGFGEANLVSGAFQPSAKLFLQLFVAIRERPEPRIARNICI